MPPTVQSPPAAAALGARPPLTAWDWLRWFAAQAEVPLPAMEPLAPAALPFPYRPLLAHGQDMTSTLERYYGRRLGLQALRREQRPPYYAREVLLTAGELPVEYGVICIRLAAFPAPLQEAILAERLPLGRLLQDHDQPCICRPQQFFRLAASPYLSRQFGRPSAPAFYGRRNLLLNAERRLLADVIEILSPAAENHPAGRLPVDWSATFGQSHWEEDAL